MTAESLLFGVLLIVMGQTQDLLFQKMTFSALALNLSAELPQAVGYLGAGLYEEFLFRLLLLSGLFLVLTRCRVPRSWSMGAAAIGSSLLFAAAHYVGPAADAYDHFGFVFRFVAGLYFAGLYVFRGFGIAVGAHAAYDLIVGLSLTPEV
jgi:membrane protease YdiL (CAAX protease family)